MKFPSRSKGPSIRPFAQLLRVLEVIHEALINDLPVTKRDVYYQDVGLFKSQRIVDQLVDDIAATIDVGRGDLNMRASLKGLLCGTGLRIHTVDGDVLVATNSEARSSLTLLKPIESDGFVPQPILVPMAQDVSRFELDPDISWVLIVEKEAVFQTLCSLHFTNEPSLPGPGLLITGKGYPDLATRQLVATLSNNLPETIPILALVDGDAYGLDIVSTYKFGSQALRHEEHILAAERVECIGLWASELAKLGIDQDTMLPISCADEKKALAMLRRPSSALPLLWKRELMTILHTRRKAEIEILTSVRVCLEDQPVSPSSPPRSRHPLVQYLSSKIRGRIDASAICF
ncbi:Spo11/DNA topoisomerase VI subunit A [Amylostereum chailletii]|nr:Spo11/DNA topoisomerase VI subunit A [Amylostereum chailletii]